MGSRSGGADEILWCFYCAVKQPKANVFRSLGTHRRRRTRKNSFLKHTRIIKRVFIYYAAAVVVSKDLRSRYSGPTAFVVPFSSENCHPPRYFHVGIRLPETRCIVLVIIIIIITVLGF